MRLTILLVFVITTFLNGQPDTLYLNEKFKPIEKGKHSYFRLIDKMPSGKYRIRDYYRGGSIQMAGFSDQPDDEHLVGTVIRYHTDGTISSICEHKAYKKGWITFYDKNLTKTASLWCEQGIKNGVAYFFDEEGHRISRGWFKDDQPYKGIIPDFLALSMRNSYSFIVYNKGVRSKLIRKYASGNTAMVGIIDSSEYKLTSAVYYDDAGKIIGTCSYKGESPVEGKRVEYYDKIFWSFKPATVKYIETYVGGSLTLRKSYTPHGEYLGSCTYEYDAPMDGHVLELNTVNQYQRGRREGEIIVYAKGLKRIVETYTILNGIKDGRVSFVHPLNDSVFVGYYKNDYPDSGFIYHRSELCYYSGGLKNGLCRKFDNNGQLEEYAYYTNNKANGEACALGFPKLGPIKGVNRNGQPFEGDFISFNGTHHVVIHYDQGKKTTAKMYTHDSFSLFALEDYELETISYYDPDGSLRFESKLKNNKPYEGTFIKDYVESNYKGGRLSGEMRYYTRDRILLKTETYVNDTLHGPYVKYTAEGAMEAFGEYRNGAPYSGVFYDSKSKALVNYEHGHIEGMIQKKEGPFTCIQNYKNGVKNGESIWLKKIAPSGGDSILVVCFAPGAKDTLRLSGIYVDGIPSEGTFFEDGIISSYISGKKKGCSLKYNYSPGTFVLLQKEEYRNDTLHGETINWLAGKPFTSMYNRGQIVHGILPGNLEFSYGAQFRFPVYNDGKITTDSLVVIPDMKWLYTKKGLPYEGFSRRSSTLFIVDEYAKGRLIKTSLSTQPRDTLWSIVYTGDSSITYDRDKQIIARSVYSQSYSSGQCYIYSRDTLSGVVTFENDLLVSGCIIDSTIRKYTFNDDERVRLCKDSEGTLLSFDPDKSKRIRHDLFLPPEVLVPWPLVINYQFISSITEGPYIERYYDRETGRLLGTFTSSSEGRTGVQIRQQGNLYTLTHYSDGAYDSFTLGFEELLEKLNSIQH